MEWKIKQMWGKFKRVVVSNAACACTCVWRRMIDAGWYHDNVA